MPTVNLDKSKYWEVRATGTARSRCMPWNHEALQASDQRGPGCACCRCGGDDAP